MTRSDSVEGGIEEHHKNPERLSARRSQGRRSPAGRHMAIEEYAVDWSGPKSTSPCLRLLLLTDVDLPSAGRIVEWAIQGDTAFDLCVVVGDFIPRPNGWTPAAETAEQLSSEEGEMSATLAQLENIVCRVVYVPGPLDPVAHAIQPFIPHSRHGGGAAGGVRQRSGATSTPAAAAAASPAVPACGGQERQQDGWPDNRSCKQTRCSPVMQGATASGASRDPGTRDGVLHLTPTSKNLNGRDLRLAPGLAAAGFTEEAVLSSSVSRKIPGRVQSRANDESIGPTGGSRGGGKDALPGERRVDQVSYALESLARGPRAVGDGQAGDAADGSSATTSRVASNAVAKTRMNQAVILMTRLGGAWVERRDSLTSGDEANGDGVRESGGGAAGILAGVSAKFPWRSKTDDDWLPDSASNIHAMSEAAKLSISMTALRLREEATVTRLKDLWRGELHRGKNSVVVGNSQGKGRSSGREASGREILLHACSGPGAFRAVEEALAEGRGSAVRLSSTSDSSSSVESSLFHEANAGDAPEAIRDESSAREPDLAGIGCRLPGVTAVALGSLRRHGAFCVAELALPLRDGNAPGRRAGWSVGAVKFGRIDVPLCGENALEGNRS